MLAFNAKLLIIYKLKPTLKMNFIWLYVGYLFLCYYMWMSRSGELSLAETYSFHIGEEKCGNLTIAIGGKSLWNKVQYKSVNK